MIRWRNVFHWLGGLAFSIFFIWTVSLVFSDSIIPMQWDEELGLHVRKAGTVIRQRSEGWADTAIGRHGLVKGADKILADSREVFFLWGDSMADALQVSNAHKATIHYNSLAEHCLPRGITVAGGGLGVADYYFRLPAYNALSDGVVGNVILLSGMEDVLPNRYVDCHNRFLANPWRFEASECVPSNLSLSYAPAIYSLRLDFVHTMYRRLIDRDWRFMPGRVRFQKANNLMTQKPEDLEAGWDFLLSRMKERSDGFPVFMYCPIIPSLNNGTLLFEDPAFNLKRKFAMACKKNGVDFIDLSSEFAALYDHKNEFPRGFFNSPPGTGHLNESGQRIIAQALLQFFREREQ